MLLWKNPRIIHNLITPNDNYFLNSTCRQVIFCTPDYYELNWIWLSYSENPPKPILFIYIGLILMTIFLQIGIQVGRQKMSLVIPLNQPKDLQSTLLLGYFLTLLSIFFGLEKM